MEQTIVKQLDNNLKCSDYIIKNEQIILKIYSTKETLKCPYCGQNSTKIHSRYQREIQDIPIQEKQTILLLETRKMFCTNVECENTTFAEAFEFVPVKGKKNNRLIQKILYTSIESTLFIYI